MPDFLKIARLLAALGFITANALFGASAFAQDAKTDQNVKPAFRLRVAPVESTVKAGSKVFVNVTMTNATSHVISVEARAGNEGVEYPLQVLDEKGNGAPETRYGRLKNNHLTPGDPPMIDAFKGTVRTLDPGKSLTDRVTATYVHDLSQPGKYTIQVEQYDDESKTFVKSNKIRVTVIP